MVGRVGQDGSEVRQHLVERADAQARVVPCLASVEPHRVVSLVLKLSRWLEAHLVLALVISGLVAPRPAWCTCALSL